jgi:hypothetical protein
MNHEGHEDHEKTRTQNEKHHEMRGGYKLPQAPESDDALAGRSAGGSGRNSLFRVLSCSSLPPFRFSFFVFSYLRFFVFFGAFGAFVV